MYVGVYRNTHKYYKDPQHSPTLTSTYTATSVIPHLDAGSIHIHITTLTPCLIASLGFRVNAGSASGCGMEYKIASGF